MADSDPHEYGYWAFISYSHQDGKWARRIHRELETWRVPEKLVGHPTPLGHTPRRLTPIFLDRAEISTGENLSEVLQAALKVSRYLIVLCSPASAASKYVNEEILLFKAMGRSSRIVYVIIGSESASRPTSECFPPMACHGVSADGRRGEFLGEPVAADARSGKDGWPNAKLKILASLLGVKFDDLKKRDAQRQRVNRIMQALALAAIVLALLFSYVMAADAGLHMPLCDDIRAGLDNKGLSFFRPAPSMDKIRSAADALVVELKSTLMERWRDDGWIEYRAGHGKDEFDPLDQAQAIAAWADSLRLPGSGSKDELAKFRTSVVTSYRDGGRPPFPGGIDRPVWTDPYSAIALCDALGTPAVKADPALQQELTMYLEATQKSLELYRSGTDPGAWNAYLSQTDSTEHSTFASCLVLLALCEARSEGLPWNGSAANRDQLIRETFGWLVGQYHAEGPKHGWINDPKEEHITDAYDGLTVFIYCALLEAEHGDQTLVIPPPMWNDILAFLKESESWDADHAVDVGVFRISCRTKDGSTHVVEDSMRYIWWPYSIRCGMLWLRNAETRPVTLGQQIEVRRALGHLLLDLGPAELTQARNDWTYTISEALYSLESSFSKNQPKARP